MAGKIVFTTSFELEDQVTLHLLSQQESGIEVFTLDTGRPFPETYALWAETERRDGLRIRALYSKARRPRALIERREITDFIIRSCRAAPVALFSSVAVFWRLPAAPKPTSYIR